MWRIADVPVGRSLGGLIAAHPSDSTRLSPVRPSGLPDRRAVRSPPPSRRSCHL
jgi:hypothetical protein